MSKKSTEPKNEKQNEDKTYSIHDLFAAQREAENKQLHQDWWAKNWISFCGMIAAVVAAIAAIVGAVASIIGLFL